MILLVYQFNSISFVETIKQKQIIMKKSELTFTEGFTSNRAQNDNKQQSFDWMQAAKLIKDAFAKHSDLVAEAGLQNDWSCTGGEIFTDGSPTNDSYTYLSSNWAIPTLILSWDGEEQKEIDCFCEATEDNNSGTKWSDETIKELGIDLSGNKISE